MKPIVKFLLLVALLFSSCSSENGNPRVPSTDTALSTPSSTLTAVPSPTATELPALPTPTAELLPTRVVDKPVAEPEDGTPAPTLLDQHLPEREKVAETEHFVFYSQDGYFPVDTAWWVEQAEIVYDYVSERLNGAHVKNKISLGFMPPDERACPVRGLASTDQAPQVLIYAAENSPRAYLLAVLAHELGHAIPSEGFPGGLPDEPALTEGLATWASGNYWADWLGIGSLDEVIRDYLKKGTYEPLHENFELRGIYPWQDNVGADCLERRDRIYGEWGSFLGYLIEQYGWEPAYRLFRNRTEEMDGKLIRFPPDYQEIYGKSLNQLEHEWLVYLEHTESIPEIRIFQLPIR